MSLTNQYVISLSRESDGKSYGTWRSHSGGGTDSNEAFVRDQYGQPRKALGGPQTVDTITMTRTFYPETDNGILEELTAGAGKLRVVTNKQKVDPDGFAVGTPQIRKGVLKSCKPADADVNDDSPGSDTYTAEVSPDGI
jgi:hypothetical protein